MALQQGAAGATRQRAGARARVQHPGRVGLLLQGIEDAGQAGRQRRRQPGAQRRRLGRPRARPGAVFAVFARLVPVAVFFVAFTGPMPMVGARVEQCDVGRHGAVGGQLARQLERDGAAGRPAADAVRPAWLHGADRRAVQRGERADRVGAGLAFDQAGRQQRIDRHSGVEHLRQPARVVDIATPRMHQEQRRGRAARPDCDHPAGRRARRCARRQRRNQRVAVLRDELAHPRRERARGRARDQLAGRIHLQADAGRGQGAQDGVELGVRRQNSVSSSASAVAGASVPAGA